MLETPALFAVLAAMSGGDAFARSKLPNGVELTVLEVKGAPRETFFAFLPLGLAHDDADCAQWSHVLEHMLIRTTDAEGLSDGELEFNGETSDGALRLDVYAPPELAERGVQKLVAWLTRGEFDGGVLEREKQNIGRELANSSANGYGHKWATAAWAQAVRHGRSATRVRGDVTDATVDGLRDYRRRKVAIDARVRLVAIGPLAADQVAKLFAAQFGETATPDAAPASAPASTSSTHGSASLTELARGELAATWDLPTTHLVEWYLLPNATPLERATCSLLGNALALKLQADPELASAKIVALANADVELPQGRVLFLSASLPGVEAKDAAVAAFRRALDGLEQVAQFGSLDAFVGMARRELGGLPDFVQLRHQWKDRPGAEMLEAQLVLNVAMREWSTRMTFAELGAAVTATQAKDLLALRERWLASSAASRLLLTPEQGPR